MPQSRRHAYQNSLGDYFDRNTCRDRLGALSRIRLKGEIILSDCEDALKAKLEEAGAKVTLK